MKNKYGVSQKICIAISWTLTVALMVTIFCLSSQVSSKSSGLSSGVISRITELFHITLTQHTVRKTAHALEYAALCFLFSCSENKKIRTLYLNLSIYRKKTEEFDHD